MKYYELTYLLSPQLTQEEAKNQTEEIKDFIQRIGGIIDGERTGKRIKLAYPIKKEISAYLGTLEFHLAPEKIQEIQNKIGEEEKILRYLLLTKRLLKTAPRTRIAPRFIKKPEPEKKAELVEIEKKLEEILGE